MGRTHWNTKSQKLIMDNMVIHPKTRCWIWTMHKDKDGYGRVKCDTQHLGAHRVSYEVFNGEIPPKAQINHTCNNTSCVNPEHLVIGTPKSNMEYKVETGRCPTGQDHGRTHLTNQDVLDMRRRKIEEKLTNQKLADEYKISIGQVSNIILRKSWGHI